MNQLDSDRARITADLGAMIERFNATTTVDGSETTFQGQARFSPSLVGPPGRLHGGLHAYARIFPILERLEAHRNVQTFPCRIVLGLYRPLPLDESVTFAGSYSRTSAGYALSVDHAEGGKLHATATNAAGVDSHLVRFREALKVARGEAPEREIHAQRDIPMQIHRELIVMPVSREMRTTGSPTFASFVAADGRIGLPALCVGLDLIGAVSLGVRWNSRIFTTRIDLVIETDSLPAEDDFVMLALRDAEPDPECHVKPVMVGDAMVGPTKARVLLADAALTRAYAHGTLTVVPANRTPRTE